MDFSESNFTKLAKIHWFFFLWMTSVKVKVKFTLEQTTKVQRGSTDIALLFL